ncbi:MAG: class II aldolase/adducin family protein [Nocardioidaceae bacterium]|nr:MAG: class II aldolase/adducin family protein [Nocardioidaceae bacterium]
MTTDALIAQACRILGQGGQDHFCYGHVSARVDQDAIAIKAAGFPLATLDTEQVARVGLDGTNLTSHLRLHDETVMHLAIYRSRPDVRAIVHTHPVISHAASLHGPPDGVYSQDQVVFADSLAFYDSALLVSDETSAAEFAACLGDNRAALLRAHGLLTVGGSVEEAVVLAVLLDRAMHLMLTARSAGHVSAMRADEVTELRTRFDRAHATRVRDVWDALTR